MNKYLYIFPVILSLNIEAGEEILWEDKPHSDRVSSICLSGKDVVSASFDGAIKKTSANVSHTIGKHKDWVQKIICAESNIISAANDGIIAIWDGIRKVNSVQAHDWWITDIVFNRDKLVSVSLDETVKVWSYPDLKLLNSYKIYGSDKIFSAVAVNGKVFIGTTRGRMQILNLEKRPQIRMKRFTSHFTVSLSATSSDNYIFFGGSDGYITKIHINNFNKLSRKKVSAYSLSAIAMNNNKIYIGDINGALWKINSKNLNKLHKINRYPEAIHSIRISNDHMYVGYDKGYLRTFKIIEN